MLVDFLLRANVTRKRSVSLFNGLTGAKSAICVTAHYGVIRTCVGLLGITSCPRCVRLRTAQMALTSSVQVLNTAVSDLIDTCHFGGISGRSVSPLMCEMPLALIVFRIESG